MQTAKENMCSYKFLEQFAFFQRASSLHNCSFRLSTAISTVSALLHRPDSVCESRISFQVGELGIKMQLSSEMHAKLMADRPDASPKMAAEKRIQRLDSQQLEVSMAQRKLVEEIELAIRKRDSLLLRVLFLSSNIHH